MEQESIIASKSTKVISYATAAVEPIGGGVANAAAASNSAAANANSRRPMNAFLLFCKRHRAIVKEVYPNLENRHITKILGEFWGSLSLEEKLPFSDLAASYKDHLMRDQPLGAASRKSQMPPATSIEQQPSLVLQPEEDKVAQDISHASSGSSSPEPNSGSSSAPKPFKKRYLAAEKAKISGESSERKSACEALLKLAEGESSSPDVNAVAATVCNGNAKSNPYDKVKETAQFSVLRQAVWAQIAKTILTQEEEKGKNANANHDDKPINLSSQCLIPNSTIIDHIIEKVLDNGNDGAPATTSSNASEMVSISNSGGNSSSSSSSDCNETNVKERIYQSLKDDVMRRTTGGGKDGSNDLQALWNMSPNPIGVKPEAVGSTKKNGKNDPASALPKPMSGKEKAHSAPASQTGSGAPSPKGNSESVSVTLVTETDLPLNLSKTPPQTPASGLSTGIAITITTTSPAKRKLLEDDDDEVRRSARACKGRRYQEFKDAVGRRGRRPCGKSDGESSQHSEDEHIGTSNVVASSSVKNSSAAMSFSMVTPSGDGSNRLSRDEIKTRMSNGSSPFDLEKELQAIPALRPEEFQRRIQANRQQPISTKAQKQNPSTVTPQAQLPPHQQPPQVQHGGHGGEATNLVVSSQGH